MYDFETLIPLRGSWNRVQEARQESEALAFDELLLLGEHLLKLSVLGLVASVKDDPERNRYRLLHGLARANPIGDWASALEDIVRGPPAQFIHEEADPSLQQLGASAIDGHWQYEVARLLNECVRKVNPVAEGIQRRTPGYQWAREFSALRNKTKGHGAPTAATKAQLVPILEDAFGQWNSEFQLLQRSWVYLKKNLSGKYRVTPLHESGATDAFEFLKKETNHDFPNGVYLDFGEPLRVELADSDPEAFDFYVANGNNNGKRFDMVSYVSGLVKHQSASPYLASTSSLPRSHTTSLGRLELAEGANAFANLPRQPGPYVPRPDLEDAVVTALTSNPAPIITLWGSGGIGKTSVALRVLHSLLRDGPYEAVLWFSARDIDLLDDGPRTVRPDVLDQADIARELVSLLEPAGRAEKSFDPVDYLRSSLAESPTGGRLLYVFDNFETVRGPADLFRWIYDNIRHPNKALITTRLREFNGDYGIPVSGMTFDESKQLIQQTGRQLGAEQLVTESFMQDIFADSGGHPYVMKLLVGEASLVGRAGALGGMLAGRSDLLAALFERTYGNLSPLGRRAFLTVCHWRSPIPEIALQAVLLRSQERAASAEEAIDELHRSSLVEILTASEDGTRFVTVPEVARVFGERKLAVSPLRPSIDIDRDFLLEFGAVQDSSMNRGFIPRVDRFLVFLAREAEKDASVLHEYSEVLEFIGRKHPRSWLRIASLYEEFPEHGTRSADAVRRFLESPAGGSAGSDEIRITWKRLAQIHRQAEEWDEEVHALVSLSSVPDTWPSVRSQAAHRINSLWHEQEGLRERATIRLMTSQLAGLMLDELADADATYCSRLAWLLIRVEREDEARRVVRKGLELDPSDSHCRRLGDRLL